MNYRRVTQFPATLSASRMRYQRQLSAFRMRFQRRFLQAAARFARPAGLFQKSSSFIRRAALQDQHRLLEVAAGVLQRVAELSFAAAAKPPQLFSLRPTSLALIAWTSTVRPSLNPAKPYHDQRRQEAERHPLRSAGLHSRRTRDRLGTGVKPNWTIRDSPSFASLFLLAFQRNLACSRVCHSGCKTHMALQRIRHNICPLFL